MGFLTALGILAYLFLLSIFSDSFEPRAFNAEEWKKEKDIRVELVDDLVESKVLDTLTQTELLNLLGAPEKEPVYFKENGRDMVYYLGPERGLGIDSEWLLIWLKDGQVDKYEIWYD